MPLSQDIDRFICEQNVDISSFIPVFFKPLGNSVRQETLGWL